jgi:hypothetical protein
MKSTTILLGLESLELSTEVSEVGMVTVVDVEVREPRIVGVKK